MIFQLLLLMMSRYDFSRFLDKECFAKEIKVFVDDHMIMCSGMVLASNSKVFESIISTDDCIILYEFSGLVEHVRDCLTLLYGGSAKLSCANIQTILKFSVLYEIEFMYETCVGWCIDYIQGSQFNALYFYEMYHLGYFVKSLSAEKVDIKKACILFLKMNSGSFCEFIILSLKSKKQFSGEFILFLLHELPANYKTTAFDILSSWVYENENIETAITFVLKDFKMINLKHLLTGIGKKKFCDFIFFLKSHSGEISELKQIVDLQQMATVDSRVSDMLSKDHDVFDLLTSCFSVMKPEELKYQQLLHLFTVPRNRLGYETFLVNDIVLQWFKYNKPSKDIVLKICDCTVTSCHNYSTHFRQFLSVASGYHIPPLDTETPEEDARYTMFQWRLDDAMISCLKSCSALRLDIKNMRCPVFKTCPHPGSYFYMLYRFKYNNFPLYQLDKDLIYPSNQRVNAFNRIITGQFHHHQGCVRHIWAFTESKDKQRRSYVSMVTNTYEQFFVKLSEGFSDRYLACVVENELDICDPVF